MTTERKKSGERLRIDELLVLRGFATDTKEAQALVMAGKVIVNDQRVEKAGQRFPAACQMRVRDHSKYVSRGGDKLEGAISDFGTFALFKGKTVLDIGASTGGFTDFCLQHGARQVISLDIGTNQLDWGLRSDSRVVALEKTDIRDFVRADYPAIDLVVGDVSFVALEQIAAAVVTAGGDAENYFLLVKPQFELPAEDVPSGGVVHNDDDRAAAVERAVNALADHGLILERSADCRIPGAAGNREIFIWMKKKPA